MTDPGDAREFAAKHLDCAARHSVNGETLLAMSQLECAEAELRGLGKHASANVVRDIREGDVCDSSVGFELRQIAQFLFVGDAPGGRSIEVIER